MGYKSKIFGFGINDLDYNMFNIDGKRKICVFGQTWRDMIKRCNSKKTKEDRPSYKDSVCCEEWRYASVFIKWMKEQDYENKSLDKDIIKVGNNIYSVETCCFVDKKINSLLVKNKHNSNNLIGVTKIGNQYQSMISNFGKREYLGRFDNEQEASNTYCKRKSEIILSAVDSISDNRIKEGLIKHSNNFLNMVK